MSWQLVDDKKATDRLFFFSWNVLKNSTHRLTKFLDYKYDSSRTTTNTTEVQFQLYDDLDRHIVVNDKITVRIMRRPIISASRFSNYDLDVFHWEYTSINKIERETGAARIHKSNGMSLTHALTRKLVDVLKDQNPRHDAESSPEISKIMQHDIHDDRCTNDSIEAIIIILFRTSLSR